MQWLWVGLGGFLGASARYGVARALLGSSYSQGFPIATLLVNVMGSFMIGLLAFSLLSRPAEYAGFRLFMLTGFLGAFTTFSSFSLETLQLVQAGEWQRALLNAVANLLLCLGAVTLGYLLARELVSG